MFGVSSYQCDSRLLGEEGSFQWSSSHWWWPATLHTVHKRAECFFITEETDAPERMPIGRRKECYQPTRKSKCTSTSHSPLSLLWHGFNLQRRCIRTVDETDENVQQLQRWQSNGHDQVSWPLLLTKLGLVSCEKFLDFATVALSFLFDKYFLIIN